MKVFRAFIEMCSLFLVNANHISDIKASTRDKVQSTSKIYSIVAKQGN
jgi:hypothetical protein